MGAVNSELEELFQEKKRVRNPFVPIGALVTAGVLTAGLISFRQGNSHLGQKLMRARVVAQGATVALMSFVLKIETIIQDLQFSLISALCTAQANLKDFEMI
ncbi:putative inactive receptor kinase [Forsythia ovata]|uniref:Inactive receptor kinase n=1 Tax=Forsythia ovata TaxID=205694 RepID=A0ABD1PU95_9LAMI